MSIEDKRRTCLAKLVYLFRQVRGQHRPKASVHSMIMLQCHYWTDGGVVNLCSIIGFTEQSRVFAHTIIQRTDVDTEYEESRYALVFYSVDESYCEV